MADSKTVKTHGDRSRWWIVHQHQDIKVTSQAERPDVTIEKGDRVKRVYGPFTSQQLAQERAELMRSNTTRARVGRAV